MADTDIDVWGSHGTKVDKIRVADMEARGKLKTVDQLRELLSTTEPMEQLTFPVGDSFRFKLEPAWNHGLDTKQGMEPVDAYVTVGKGQGARELQLTKDAVLEATSLARLPKGPAEAYPASITENILNWWFRNGGAGDKDFKVLTVNDRAQAITRATITPFSNLRLLDQAVESIRKQYGEDASNGLVVDYKLHHSLQQTYYRLVIPEVLREIAGTGESDDNWSVGVQVKNSLVGGDQTQIDGYLFRWLCTNGAIDTHRSSGKWSRRSNGQGDDVYEWARESVDEILGGLEGALDGIQALLEMPIEGEVNDVLRDVFEQYRVPAATRQQIIANMVENDQLNMYAVQQAITQVANDAGIAPAHAEALMRTGGDLGHVAGSRCDACHRLQL